MAVRLGEMTTAAESCVSAGQVVCGAPQPLLTLTLISTPTLPAHHAAHHAAHRAAHHANALTFATALGRQDG